LAFDPRSVGPWGLPPRHPPQVPDLKGTQPEWPHLIAHPSFHGTARSSTKPSHMPPSWTPNAAFGGEPEFLTHYTDADGLRGILESRSLRATEIRFLNDPSELSYSLRRLGVHTGAPARRRTSSARPLASARPPTAGTSNHLPICAHS